MNLESIAAPGPMQTMYDALMERLRTGGETLEGIYDALADLLAFDMHNTWNKVEKSERLARIRAALAARKADLLRTAELCAQLLEKSSAQLERLVTPLLSDMVDASGAPVRHRIPPRVPREPVVWSRSGR